MVRLIVVAGALLLHPGIGAAQPAADKPHTPVYSPWTKTCLKPKDGAQVCYTTMTLRTACAPIGSATLIAKDGEPNVLRIIVPMRAYSGSATQVTIDEGMPRTEPIAACIVDVGCMSNYAVDEDLLAGLKKGTTLIIEGLRGDKQVRFTLPLGGFAEASGGPGFDPRAAEAPVEELRRQLADRPLARCLSERPIQPPRP